MNLFWLSLKCMCHYLKCCLRISVFVLHVCIFFFFFLAPLFYSLSWIWHSDITTGVIPNIIKYPSHVFVFKGKRLENLTLKVLRNRYNDNQPKIYRMKKILHNVTLEYTERLWKAMRGERGRDRDRQRENLYALTC